MLQKEYYAENKTVLNELNKLYYLQNKETIYDRQKRYRTVNKELLNRLQREAYHRNAPPRTKKKWVTLSDIRAFFDSVRDRLYIVGPNDWYRISRKQISGVGGGGLYHKFGNLGQALIYAYPEMEWERAKFLIHRKQSRQRWLRVVLERIIPSNTLVFEDFLHPCLLWDENTNFKMQLDIWVPKFSLALEYQGEHHYNDLNNAYGPTGTLALYTLRDTKKKRACANLGITLITIPYWWDGSQNSLASTLHHLRPDIFPAVDTPPIPTNLPNTTKQVIESPEENYIRAFLMHAHEWTTQQDPTGWLISEKLDGVRAYWDGSKMFSKSGKVLRVPLELTRALPSNVHFDGELWMGYDRLSELQCIMKKTEFLSDIESVSEMWQDVQYCVFDAPIYPGFYPDRHAFASDVITRCYSSSFNIRVIPIERCLGLEHLQTVLYDVSYKKGEGIMLYHPEAIYSSGRTNNLLKVEAYTEEDMKFLECSHNSYSFICEQLNGASCVVRCTGWEYKKAPLTGTVLTVRYSNEFQTNYKMKKVPMFHKIRSDLSWDDLKNNELFKM